MRQEIHEIIKAIEPHDAQEKIHIEETLRWIESGEEIFRVQKPDIPPKHLVCYFALLDVEAQKVLLVDHIKAQLWVPSGGHVEMNEHPRETVERECLEELGIKPDFLSDSPLFLTSTVTVGLTAGHTDVSLWYALKGQSHERVIFDHGEFNDVRWFAFNEIPYKRAEPHMKRFVGKLRQSL